MHSDIAATGTLRVGARARGSSSSSSSSGSSGNSSSSRSTANVLDLIHKSVLQTQLCNAHSLPTDCPTREKRGWMGDAQWTAEEASLNFDTSAFYTNFLRTISDVQMKGCRPTTEQFKLEPPFHTCCSPTLDALHPTIFQCSPMSGGASDTAGSIPDVVPELWGNGGGRGYPGSPVWASALVAISDAVFARFGARSDAIQQRWPNLVAYMAFNKRQAAFAPGKTLPQYGLLGDWLADQALCPGSSDGCLTDPGFVTGNPTSAFQVRDFTMYRYTVQFLRTFSQKLTRSPLTYFIHFSTSSTSSRWSRSQRR